MPLLRRDDPARCRGADSHTGATEDRRPVPPRDATSRNGLPARRRPYLYRGNGRDELTGWWDIPALPVAPLRALPPLDVCEAIEPEWDPERAAGVDF